MRSAAADAQGFLSMLRNEHTAAGCGDGERTAAADGKLVEKRAVLGALV